MLARLGQNAATTSAHENVPLFTRVLASRFDAARRLLDAFRGVNEHRHIKGLPDTVSASLQRIAVGGRLVASYSRRLIPSLVTSVAASLLCASAVDARPFRGSVPVDVLLCRTSDSGTPPNDANHYRRLILNNGTGGVADYWRDISYGGINNAGSEVYGWFEMTQNTEQFRALDRGAKIQACVAAAEAGGRTVPEGRIRYVITFPSVDLFAKGRTAFLPFSANVGAVVHEGGHGIGLNHTYSNDSSYQNASWSAPGEYDDPWDAMSWANSFTVPTPFGNGPPGLVAHHLDRMGWLPRNRVVTHGADGRFDVTYTLTALGHPETPGVLALRVPFDPSDLFRYYTVEFRKKSRWDAGIRADTVLIHEVARKRDDSGDLVGAQIARLQRDIGAALRPPMQSINMNGVEITVVSINSAGNQATVRVRSAIVERCLEGFVWREARPSDRVCVTGAERQQVRDDNAQAAARRNPDGGPWGPDTCRQGYVWREAFAGDRVCVASAERTNAREQNEQAASRVNPARVVYGPNTCKQGFVWREADASDWVCVSPAVRARTQDENAQAAARRNPGGGAFGPNTCRSGFVWRSAFPMDMVCVEASSRTEAREDNAEASSRLAIR